MMPMSEEPSLIEVVTVIPKQKIKNYEVIHCAPVHLGCIASPLSAEAEDQNYMRSRGKLPL